MVDSIKAWLNGPKDYDAGVQLLLEYSTDERLKRLFTMEAATDFKRKLLADTLRKMLTAGKEVVKASVIIQEKTVATLKAGGRWPEEKDAVVNALWLEWKPLFGEMNNLQARIYDVAKAGIDDPQQRVEAGKMAHRILDLDDACDEIYQKRDHYLKHGKLPAENKLVEEIVDPVKLPLALANAQRYVREFKIKVKKNPENVRQAAKLKEWEEKVAHYKRLLKID